MMRWLILAMVIGCSSSKERVTVLAAGQGGDAGQADGVAGSGGSSSTTSVDAGPIEVDTGVEVETSLEAALDTALDTAIDPCPPNSVDGYQSIPEIRASNPLNCYAQVDGRKIMWPDTGFPSQVCCVGGITAAWRDDTGCGERGILFSEPDRSVACDTGGDMLGSPIEAVRCCS